MDAQARHQGRDPHQRAAAGEGVEPSTRAHTRHGLLTAALLPKTSQRDHHTISHDARRKAARSECVQRHAMRFDALTVVCQNRCRMLLPKFNPTNPLKEAGSLWWTLRPDTRVGIPTNARRLAREWSPPLGTYAARPADSCVGHAVCCAGAGAHCAGPYCPRSSSSGSAWRLSSCPIPPRARCMGRAQHCEAFMPEAPPELNPRYPAIVTAMAAHWYATWRHSAPTWTGASTRSAGPSRRMWAPQKAALFALRTTWLVGARTQCRHDQLTSPLTSATATATAP